MTHPPVIILLEGCDKTGKSTEAERLASLFPNSRVVHFGVPETNPFDDYRAALIEADQFDGTTIIDRLHWSNIAYQTVYRNDADDPRRMSDAQRHELDLVLNAIGGVVLLKVRPIDEIAAAMDDEDYGQADPAKIGALQKIFIGLWAGQEVPEAEVGYVTKLGRPGSLTRFLVPFGDVLPLTSLVQAQNLRAQAIEDRDSRGLDL